MTKTTPDAGVGRPAPELVLPDEHGVEQSLESRRGKPVFVSFLSHAA